MKSSRTSHRIECGHWSPKRGMELPQSKLNETIVAQVRAQHAAKEELKRVLDANFSAAAFAKRYGVNVNTIHKVLTYATWKHVLERNEQ